MKRLLAAISATLLSLPALAAYYDQTMIDNLVENEAVGVRLYDAGEHARAFMILRETAAKGLKTSQYVIAFMFMKGEGVDKNMLYGLAWLGLAAESGQEDWLAMYDKFYDSLSAAQKSMLDEKVEEFRARHGAAVQGVTCAKSAALGSRTIQMRCRKHEGTYPDHDIDMPISP